MVVEKERSHSGSNGVSFSTLPRRERWARVSVLMEVLRVHRGGNGEFTTGIILNQAMFPERWGLGRCGAGRPEQQAAPIEKGRNFHGRADEGRVRAEMGRLRLFRTEVKAVAF